MKEKDFYKILGVEKDSKPENIKKRYRDLCKTHHPDKGGDEEEFKKISEAYETLGDPKKRSEYDNMGRFDYGKYESFFRGNNRWGSGFQHIKIKGETLNLNIKLTLEEIFSGATKTFKYNHYITCHNCNGSGCIKCTDKGIILENDTLDIVIPRNVGNNSVLVVPGKGHAIKEGESGDIRILITELPHKSFIRDGFNLVHIITLPYYDAILGSKLELDRIDGGKLQFNVPRYVNKDSVFKIMENGMWVGDFNMRGDLIIRFNITLPNILDEESLNLIKKIKENGEKN